MIINDGKLYGVLTKKNIESTIKVYSEILIREQKDMIKVISPEWERAKEFGEDIRRNWIQTIQSRIDSANKILEQKQKELLFFESEV